MMRAGHVQDQSVPVVNKRTAVSPQCPCALHDDERLTGIVEMDWLTLLMRFKAIAEDASKSRETVTMSKIAQDHW